MDIGIIEWDGKYNSGFRGKKTITTISSMLEILETRDPDGDAEYVLYRADMKNQCLMLNVSSNRWHLYYIPETDDSAGFYSLGEDSSNDEDVNLPAGSNIYVPCHSLVSSAIAYQAAQEFIETADKPTCVRWFEL